MASRARVLCSTIVALAAFVACAREARAQVHWDLGVHGGVSKRFLTDRSCVANVSCLDGFFGPVVGVEGHIALLPFVRVGAYGQFEYSPIDGGPETRNLYAFGAQGRLISPWPRGDWRMWLSLGVGYVAVYAPHYPFKLHPDPNKPDTVISASVDGSGGGYLEIPVGVGVSYALRKPWTLYAELTGRFGGGFWGTLYGENDGRNVTRSDGVPSTVAPTGSDFFSLGLVVGVGLDM